MFIILLGRKVLVLQTQIKSKMEKKNKITVKDFTIRTTTINGVDYICITDIARQKNEAEPKDVVKNWMRQKNTLGNILDYGRNFITPILKGSNSPPFWQKQVVTLLR